MFLVMTILTGELLAIGERELEMLVLQLRKGQSYTLKSH